MKKENIYKLVEMGYKGGSDYNLYITEFIKKLNDEKYFEMAEHIQKLQFENSKVSFSSIRKNNNQKNNKKSFVFPESVDKETTLIIEGYKKGLIKKILLIGKPGTGKTSYVEWIKDLMNLPLINIKLSDILDFKYGESIKKMETIMNEYKNVKCIIFFDEADSIFRKRGTVNDIYETDRIVSTMLKELDKEFEPLIFFASNLYNELDKAIIRRMDEIINFNAYKHEELIKIWNDYSKYYKISNNIDFNTLNDFIYRMNDKIVPSDLKNIAKKIAILFLNNKEDNNLWIEDILNDYFNYRSGVYNEK